MLALSRPSVAVLLAVPLSVVDDQLAIPMPNRAAAGETSLPVSPGLVTALPAPPVEEEGDGNRAIRFVEKWYEEFRDRQQD